MSQKKGREWSVSERLEIVKARQKGITLDEVHMLYGVSSQSVSTWVRAYEENGLNGLERTMRGRKMRKISPKVEAAEEIVKEEMAEHPTSGIGKVQGILYRQGFLKMAKETVKRLLWRTKGITTKKRGTVRNKPRKVRSFERAKPNELWQTDIMGFMLKGQYRVYLIGFMDDYSRFMVSWGLYRFQTAANVQEVFRAGIEKHGLPKEVLSDNGRQYYTWRGKSQFTSMLTKLGIRHVRSRPYHPQTLGKIESFWRNLLQECLMITPIGSFEEAESKIGEYVEYYNFKRPHQGIGNLMPSDRYYSVEGQVEEIIRRNTQQVEDGTISAPGYSKPMYLVGNLGGQEIRLIARDAQLSVEKRPEVMVELKGEEKAKKEQGNDNVETGTGEVGESAGEVRPVDVGDSGSQTSEGVMPGGRSIAGAILPVDGAVAGDGIGGVGGETTGAEEEMERKPDGGDGTVGKENGDIGKETARGEERERTHRDSVKYGAQDNSEAGLGQCGRAV